MAKSVRWLLALAFGAALVVLPYLYYCRQRAHYRGFRVVTPGVLYRSGQLSPDGFRQIAYTHGIRTVITLREDDGLEHDADKLEEAYCRKNHIAHVRIPAPRWSSPSGPPPAGKAVAKFLQVLRDRKQYPQPVLVHCFAGVHRAGAYCALYRMEFERWSPQDAVAEMKRCGYTTIDHEDDIRCFLLGYRPSWKKKRAAF